jgi:hypothetical protein
LFYLFFVLLISDHRYYLDAVNFENLQDPQEEDFEQQLAGNQGKCSLTMLSFHQPLLFRWQMTEGAITTTATT